MMEYICPNGIFLPKRFFFIYNLYEVFELEYKVSYIALQSSFQLKKKILAFDTRFNIC